jgi:isoaspartyl peptidase/L-asparaginase-like protein (Ntn-hydrolase superfamily)
MTMARAKAQIIIHGGAVTDKHYQNEPAMRFLRECCARAYARLLSGEPATNTVELAVTEMEISGLFLAGKGAHPNAAGGFELDASIMDGRDASGGGVACVVGARCAIGLAQRVRTSRTVLLVGPGVQLAFPNDPAWLLESERDYFEPLADVSNSAKASGLSTVGAAVVDSYGNCAAGTATGGIIGKLPGRVGDTPIIGAGTWADKKVAVSCTGQGEFFLRAAAARSVSARMSYASMSLEDSVGGTIVDVAALGGIGGIVAASRDRVAWQHNANGLKRAWVDEVGEIQVAV